MNGAAPALRFDGKSVVVTGVGRAGQVGEVVAKEFAKRGAAVAMSGPVAESDPAVFQRQLAINLGSAYGATCVCIPFMRAAGGGGIVFMAAAAILPGGKVAGMAGYAAAKAGVTALMRAVAQEERPNGIRANALAPMAIRTGVNLESMGAKFAYVERESVAGVIAFLCSTEAANITGQVIELA